MSIDPNIIIAYLTGDATDEEQELLRAWRVSSPENEQAFQRRVGVWELLGELPAAEASGLATPKASTTIIPMAESLRSRGRPRRRRIPGWGLSIAASVLIGIALGALWAGRSAEERFSAGEIITGVGELATVTLEDGTVVRLRGQSRLQFGPSLGARDVFLEGQAYFAVPPGQEEPFQVHTPNGQITVLGTRFDVASRDDDVRVVVVQGKVEMDVGDQQVNLQASEGGRLGPTGAPVVEEVDDVYRATDWVGAFIAYEATPLTEVAREFESRFGVAIDIADPELASRTISGWFADQSPAEMFGNICIAVDARCDTSGEILRMEMREAAPLPAAPDTI